MKNVTKFIHSILLVLLFSCVGTTAFTMNNSSEQTETDAVSALVKRKQDCVESSINKIQKTITPPLKETLLLIWEYADAETKKNLRETNKALFCNLPNSFINLTLNVLNEHTLNRLTRFSDEYKSVKINPYLQKKITDGYAWRQSDGHCGHKYKNNGFMYVLIRSDYQLFEQTMNVCQKISSLDLSNTPHDIFNDISKTIEKGLLQKLEILHLNKIESISLDAVRMILEKFPELRALSLSETDTYKVNNSANTSLGSVLSHLNKNLKLEELTWSHRTGQNFIKNLFVYTPNLKKLTLYQICDSPHMKTDLEWLTANKIPNQLKELHLISNNMNPINPETVTLFILYCPQLEALTLRSLRDSILPLIELIKNEKLEKLKKLDLSFTDVTGEQKATIQELLPACEIIQDDRK